jgi:hypothetical protein
VSRPVTPELTGSRAAGLAAAVALSLPGPARAADPTPEERAACVAKHESAQISRRDGKLRAARTALLQCVRASCPSAIRSDCLEWLPELERSLPSVVIAARSPKGDESSGRVLLDGEVLAARLDGQALDVDPGSHLFRVEVPPYEAVEQRVVIRTGEKNRELLVNVGQPPATLSGAPNGGASAPPDRYRPVPPAVYALGGVTLAGLAAFAGLGASGLAMRSSLTCAPFCTDDQVRPAKVRFLAADISLGVAGVAAVATIVVFATRPAVRRDTAPRAATLTLLPAANGALIGIRGDL